MKRRDFLKGMLALGLVVPSTKFIIDMGANLAPKESERDRFIRLLSEKIRRAEEQFMENYTRDLYSNGQYDLGQIVTETMRSRSDGLVEHVTQRNVLLDAIERRGISRCIV